METQDLILFHVTPVENVQSITKYGLDPKVKYPTRKDRTSYLVSPGALMWAIAHVQNRHSQRAQYLTVFWFKCEEIGAQKFMGKGLYRVRLPIPPDMVWKNEQAEVFLGAFAKGQSPLDVVNSWIPF